MKTRHAFLSLLALAALATTARADDAITIAHAYKVGDVGHYKISMTTNVMGADASLEQKVKMTVKELKANGDVVIVEESEGGKITFNGQEQDLPQTPPVTQTRDKLGRLVALKKEDNPQGFIAPEIEQIMAMLQMALLPDKAVKPGDSWTNDQDNPAVKGKKIAIKTTYVSTDKVNGTDLLKLKQTAEAETDANGQKMVWDSTSWLDPTTGALARSEVKLKDLPTIAGLVQVDLKMEAVKGDSDKKDAAKEAK